MRRLLFIFLLAAGCTATEVPGPGTFDGTAAMAARLAALADSTDTNPVINAHANRARLARLLEVGPPPNPEQAFFWRLNLAQEYLRAGENEAAIAGFEEALEEAERLQAPQRLAILDLLAVSYLRLGEQENCIDDPTVDRCIWPIVENGVHRYPRGSQNAIERYEEILRQDPDDLNSRWLLNVAYMTLGAWPEGVPRAHRLPPVVSEYDLPRFPDRAPATGTAVEGLSGGVVMEDLDGDGLLDIMASSWGLRDPIRLFLNAGDGTFEEADTGLDGITGGLNLVHADYDNDGDSDVLVLRGAWLYHGWPNSLLRNEGGGRFVDVTQAAGLAGEFPSHSAAWADYDNDGWVDLFVGHETNPEAGFNPSQLFRNRGDGTFEDVSEETGLRVIGYVKGAVWGDVNADGRPDLYVSNLYAPNQLWMNTPAGFVEQAGAAGVTEPEDSFPTWFWDYDNDGHLDLFVSGWRATAGDVAAEYLGRPFRAEPPRLFRNRGDGTFEDRTEAAGLQRVLYTMGTNFGDLDGDGWLDFYVGTGDPDFRALMPNRMFRNARGLFQDVTAVGGFGHLQKGHGVAFGDLDHDGDQDIYAVMGGAFEGDVFRNVLFENPLDVSGWITLRLEGTESNRSAIGAQVIAQTGSERIHRTVGSGGSFGAHSFRVYLGLAGAAEVESLEVRWPSGRVDRFEAVAAGKNYRLLEGTGQLVTLDLPRFPLAVQPPESGH